MANPILDRWQQWSRRPGGAWLFSRAIGWMAPYSSTIRARVRELAAGRAVVEMADRRRVRNHLRSIHAAALLNLAELTGGLLATVSMPADARMIPTGLSMDFVKKARGTLHAHGTCPVPESNARAEIEARVEIRDSADDAVANATVRILVGPKV